MFKRVREWLSDESNFVGPMHAFFPIKIMKESAKEMLEKLESKELILLFAATVPNERSTHHPSLHVDENKRNILELFVPESVRAGNNLRKPEWALRKIGDQSLQALALDALALYTDVVYCVNHREPLVAPDIIKKKKEAALAPL